MGQETGPLLDLRRLRYFVAVAEELHFGRAAERLYIAQPVLSRQIRKLEQEVGADLLTRSSRNVALTAAGERVLDEARSLLAAADASRRRIGDIARDRAELRIGFFVGDEFTAALEAFAALHSDVEVNLVRIYWDDQIDALRKERVDVAFLHLPVDDDGLALVPLRSEPRLAVLPVRHPAADKHQISITELADDPVVIQRGASPAWQAFHNVDPRPDGRRPRPGPEAGNLEEKLQHVAAGRAISFVPASVAATVSQPGIVYVPVSDILPITICLAWSSGATSPLIAAFADCVKNARKEPRP